jgi:hypothetical protein
VNAEPVEVQTLRLSKKTSCWQLVKAVVYLILAEKVVIAGGMTVSQKSVLWVNVTRLKQELVKSKIFRSFDTLRKSVRNYSATCKDKSVILLDL